MRWIVTCPEGGNAPTGYGVYLRYPGYSLCMPIPFNVIARTVRGWWYRTKYPHNGGRWPSDIVQSYQMGWRDYDDYMIARVGKTPSEMAEIQKLHWGKSIIDIWGMPKGKSMQEIAAEQAQR